MDNGEVTVTVTMRGLSDPAETALQVAMFMKRSLYQVHGKSGEFAAEVDATYKGMLPEQAIHIEI
jgi:hypothetical protein